MPRRPDRSKPRTEAEESPKETDRKLDWAAGVNLIMRKNLVILLMIAGVAAADPSDEAREFLTVPGAEQILLKDYVELWDTASLEPELRGLLARVIQGRPVTVGDEVAFVEPETYHGFSLDLNEDGNSEHFVLNPGIGGTGGHAFEVISRDDGVWRRVGGFQSAALFLSRNDADEPVLVVFGRGGGGHFIRRDHEFIRGAWRAVRGWKFDNGGITEVDVLPTKIQESELPYPPQDAAPARPSRRSSPNGSGRPGAAGSADAHDLSCGQKNSGGVIPARSGMFLLALLLVILAGLSIRRHLAR